jgi:type III secretion protein C
MKTLRFGWIGSRGTCRLWALSVVAAAVLVAGAGPAAATPINWDAKNAMPPIAARDMPLQDFMQALLAPQGLAVVVSPLASQKTVNGRFTGNPGKVFNSVVSTSLLLPYFDGSTLYIFASSEVQRKTVTLSPASAERVIATLSQLQLHDGRYNTFTAVPASGLLRLSGAKPFVDQFQEIVRSVQLSGGTSPEQLGVYPLKYAFAWDVTIASAGKQIVVPGIASLLRNLLGVGGLPTGVATRPRSSVSKLRGKGFSGGNETDALAAAEATGADDAYEPMVRSGNAGGPMVAAEVRSNSVVVRDTPDRLPRYAELIKALDIEPVMVEFETTIVDVNTDQLQELGVNWRLARSGNEVRLGQGNNSDLQLRGPGVNDVTPIGRGLGWSTILDSGRLIARITALAADGNARVVSRAQVATMANIESTISSNQTSYVRVGGFQEVDLFPITAATSVRVTPQVFSRGDRQIVSMIVNIRDGRFTDAVVDNIPSVKEVSLSTNGLVPENQTFVIGGFSQDSSSKRTDKVPLLGDVPFLGGLFRTTTDQVVRAERLFLVTPRVITVSKLLEQPTVQQPTPGGPASFLTWPKAGDRATPSEERPLDVSRTFGSAVTP